MSCTNTTSMYLGISTDICASGSASRSGNTITVSGTLSVSQGSSWNTNAIYGYIDGSTTWTKVKNSGNVTSGSANFSFTFTDANAGSRTYTAVFQVWNNAETGPVGGSASTTFSVSWPAGTVAPTTPTVSASNPGTTNTNSVTWGTTSMGTPSSGTVYLYGGTSASPTTQLTTKTTTGNTTYTHSSLSSNTKYYYRSRANNGQWSSYSSDATAVTRAAAPTVSVGTRTANSIQINYSTAADGNAYSKAIQYSLDGTNWSTGATVSTGSASSGSYNITGRTANTSYSVRTRVNTTAGTTVGSTLTAVTLPATPTLSISNITASSATLNYSLSADGGAYTKYLQISLDNGNTWETIATVSSGSATSGTYALEFLEKAKTYTVIGRVQTAFGDSTTTSVTFVASNDKLYGSVNGSAKKIVKIYGPVNSQTKKVVKLYGSLNGRAKLIFKEK